MAYNPDEHLSLNINGTTITKETSVAGQYGSLTVNADGAFTYTTERIGENLLESFACTVTDAAGNTAEAHLYIRLSDNAPVFPNTGGTAEGIVAVETDAVPSAGRSLFSAENSAPFDIVGCMLARTTADDGEPDAPAVTASALSDMPSPAEVPLVGMPRPQDADAPRQADI